MRYSVWATVLLVASLLTSIVTGWPWITLSHDVLLYKFLGSVVDMELPEGTRVLAAESAFGLLMGGSNHCDAAVMAMLSSDREPAALSGHLPPATAIAWPWFQPMGKGYELFLVEAEDLYYVSPHGLHRVGPDGLLVDRAYDVMLDHGIRPGVASLMAETAHVPGRRYLIVAVDQYYGSVDLRCH